MPDALYILDANTATSVLSGVTQHSFSTWAMDLRAQVTGGTVQTYSWDLTNAPDATSVGGSSTYRLQFSWASFTGAVRTDSITLTTTNTDQSHQSQTITFKDQTPLLTWPVSRLISPFTNATPPPRPELWQIFRETATSMPTVCPSRSHGIRVYWRSCAMTPQ